MAPSTPHRSQPRHSKHLERADLIKLDLYTNNQISQLFNSLILNDDGDPLPLPSLGFRPKKLFDKSDTSMDLDTPTDEDPLSSSGGAFGSSHNAAAVSDRFAHLHRGDSDLRLPQRVLRSQGLVFASTDHTPSSTHLKLKLHRQSISGSLLIKRSDKLLHLSIDRRNNTRHSLPPQSPEKENTAPHPDNAAKHLMLHSPHNHAPFKRPHTLVSQSPLPSHKGPAEAPPQLSLGSTAPPLALRVRLQDRLFGAKLPGRTLLAQDRQLTLPNVLPILSKTAKMRKTLAPAEIGLSPFGRGAAEHPPAHELPLRSLKGPKDGRRFLFFRRNSRDGERPLMESTSPTQPQTAPETSSTTPTLYKFAKPLHSAFVSTGLLKKNSKMVFNTAPGSDKKGNKSHVMPDTPCKRQPLLLSGFGLGTSTPVEAAAARHPLIDFAADGGLHLTPLPRAPETIPSGRDAGSGAGSSGDISSALHRVIHENQSPSLRAGSHTPISGHLGSGSSHNSSGSGTNTRRLQNCLLAFTDDFNEYQPLSIFDTADVNMDVDELMQTPTKLLVRKSSSAPAYNTTANLLHLMLSGHPDATHMTTMDSAGGMLARKSGPYRLQLHLDTAPDALANVLVAEDGRVLVPHTPVDTRMALRLLHNLSNTNSSMDSFERDRAAFMLVFGDGEQATSGYLHEVDDAHLVLKFGVRNLKEVGTGEFSRVFELLFQGGKYAIKRSKKQLTGRVERERFMQEVAVLRQLTEVCDPRVAESTLTLTLSGRQAASGDASDAYVNGLVDYLVRYVELWQFNQHCYLMTEYCENGTLDDFLQTTVNSKLDEFRVWKILIEMLLGLQYIHRHGVLHLDIKPLNVFVTFDGLLKIGDFGMLTHYPIQHLFDLEGDRNYIAPEVLSAKSYTPFADIFLLGLMIIEIAANIVLPDNGTPWRKLRLGDLLDAGRLLLDNIADFMRRGLFLDPLLMRTGAAVRLKPLGLLNPEPPARPPSPLLHALLLPLTTPLLLLLAREPVGIDAVCDGALPAWAPAFLVDNLMRLDTLVKRMVEPRPFLRPTAGDILLSPECMLVEARRHLGALIYEGEFGPDPEEPKTNEV